MPPVAIVHIPASAAGVPGSGQLYVDPGGSGGGGGGAGVGVGGGVGGGGGFQASMARTSLGVSRCELAHIPSGPLSSPPP